MKSESTFNVLQAIRSFFKAIFGEPERTSPQHVDPALVTFARLGLLAYYC